MITLCTNFQKTVIPAHIKFYNIASMLLWRIKVKWNGVHSVKRGREREKGQKHNRMMDALISTVEIACFFFRVKINPIFFKNKSRSGYYVTKQNKK